MKNEINLIDVNLYKQNPKMLEDASYLRNNLKELHESGLRFMDFPESVRRNPIFVTEYFSKIEATKKEYKYIPEELLKDQFFISACLILNPDIYLLADVSCHTDFAFKTLKKYQTEKYLKYASDSNLKDKEFCKEALGANVENFQYMPKEFREDKELILNNLSEKFYYSNKYERAEQIVKYIPEHVFEDRKFVIDMLDKNMEVFKFLPTKYKSDSTIAYNVICNDSSFFSYADITLKQNKEFVFKLLEYGEQANNRYWANNRKFYNTHIIEELDETYFTREFCEKYSLSIRKTYEKMNKKVRGNLEIVRAVYLFNLENTIDGEYYQAKFINKIPNELLVREIKDFVAASNYKDLYQEVGHTRLVKLIETFQLRKDLNSELSSNTPTSKKLKL
jgi:hypothetical protein